MKKIIVCTTIYDTPELIKYASFEDWEFVVVNDLKTPVLNIKNATVLTVEDQKKLGYNICDIIPWNSIQRRNIGYIYALANGADIIATVDNDNFPLENWEFPLLDKTSNLKVVEEPDFFDIVRYATDDAIWHRGTLYERLNEKIQYKIVERPVKTGVQANLWLNDPDTDGISRLTRNVALGKERIARFNDYICVGKGVFSPYNSQNTAFLREFLVAALLPFGSYFNRMDDIWSAYLTERLLWETDYHISFGSPSVRQDRNPHDIWKDIDGEIAFSAKLNKLLSFLRSITFKTKNPIENFINLSEKLEKTDLAPSNYSELWKRWIKDFEKYF